MGCRRLVRDYELLPQTSETFIYLADPCHGQAVDVILDPSKLFKHPLSSIAKKDNSPAVNGINIKVSPPFWLNNDWNVLFDRKIHVYYLHKLKILIQLNAQIPNVFTINCNY